MHLLVLALFALLSCCLGIDIPPFIKPCRLESPDFVACASKEANKVIAILAPGIKEAGFPSLQPYQFKEAFYENDQVSIKFLDGTVEGLDTMVVDKISFHLDDPHFYLHSIIKQMKMTAKYDIQGKLLGEEIHSSGPVELALDNVDFDNPVYFRVITKDDGLEYVKIMKHPLKLTPTRSHFNFGNFYGGDTEKNNQFKQKVSANSKQFGEEVLPAVAQVLNDLMQKNVFENLAEVVPYEQIFPK